MNRLSVATISLATAIAVMTLGYATPSYAGKPDCADDNTHPSCKTDDGEGAKFKVTIVGNGNLLAGGSGDDLWAEGYNGKNGIGINASSTDVSDPGTLTGLSNFIGETDDACFPSEYLDPHTSEFQLHQAIIKPGKKGRAEASFWFHGTTKQGLRILYVLKLFGKFADGTVWPGPQTLEMDKWELKVENESKTIKDMSCQSDEVMEGFVSIKVE